MEIKGTPTKILDKETKKTLQDYVCPWCGYKFKQYVRTAETNGRHTVSDQVQCSKCDNFLKTW